MSQFPWFKLAGITLGFVGFGYGLMKATTPTEEQLYKELAPDLKRQVDAARAARLTREAEMKRLVEAQNSSASPPEPNQPIWADPPHPKK